LQQEEHKQQCAEGRQLDYSAMRQSHCYDDSLLTLLLCKAEEEGKGGREEKESCISMYVVAVKVMV